MAKINSPEDEIIFRAVDFYEGDLKYVVSGGIYGLVVRESYPTFLFP